VLNEHHETRYVIYFHSQRKNGVHEQHKTPKTAYCCFSAAIPVVDTGQGRHEDDDKDDYGDDDDYGEDKDDDKDDEDEEDYGDDDNYGKDEDNDKDKDEDEDEDEDEDGDDDENDG